MKGNLPVCVNVHFESQPTEIVIDRQFVISLLSTPSPSSSFPLLSLHLLPSPPPFLILITHSLLSLLFPSGTSISSSILVLLPGSAD